MHCTDGALDVTDQKGDPIDDKLEMGGLSSPSVRGHDVPAQLLSSEIGSGNLVAD